MSHNPVIKKKKNSKSFLFLINTAGQAYTWRYCIDHFLKNGDTVSLLARDQGPVLSILDTFGFKYSSFKMKKAMS